MSRANKLALANALADVLADHGGLYQRDAQIVRNLRDRLFSRLSIAALSEAVVIAGVAARCGECLPCQEWILTPDQAEPCENAEVQS